ncbi:MAG: hypothetical protein IKR36_02835, partial [Clostridia bacterium]|nr:hypothetical protein [Clostridia bacterium]
MKHSTILALLLALCLLLGSLPASATIPCPPHSFGPWRVEEAPTCTTPGRESRQCQYCYETETRYPAALGHNFQFVVRDQPSCTKQGYGIDMCTRCGATRDNGRPIDALGHNYQRTVAQEPTCTSAGTAVYTCSRCGDAYREPIPASNHKWGPWQPGDPATCVQHGTRYHDCTRCGAREWERDYTTGLGDHDWGDWVTVKEPTATEPGLQERTCKVDANHKEQQEIPATGEPEADPATDEPAEEAKPALKLVVDQWEKVKEAYEPYDPKHYYNNSIGQQFIVTNTGNVRLRYKIVGIAGNNVDMAAEYPNVRHYFSSGGALPPGYTDYGMGSSQVQYNYIVGMNGMIPDPEDSPYAGTDRVSYMVYGYAVDDTELTTPICQDGPVVFEYKIAKPGPEPWPIPEESQLEVEIYRWLSSTIPSDPAGYQLGETWATQVYIKNNGTEPVDVVKYRVDYIASGCDKFYTSHTSWPTDGATWFDVDCTVFGQLKPYSGYIYDAWFASSIYGDITPKDVERGYIQAMATVTWIDPLTGAERKSYSNVWHMPVISKTGLVLNKGYKDPANGEYFEEGEQIEWTLSMKNNSKEPIKDITVTDNGATIGMFAEVTPEQGEIKLGVPKYTVTEYDAKVIGKVTNIANATGTDLKGVEHTYPSNPAVAKAGNKAPDPNDGDGGGGTDPLGPIYGYDIAVSIIKAEAHGPAQEDWYALNENVDYTVTVKNTGKDPIENVTVYDSLNGFAPIGTVGSLA